MLKLYTDKSKFAPDDILEWNDGVFSKFTKSLDFTDTDKEFMWKYDGAKLTGGNNTMYGPLVQTRYGDAFAVNLSTGLKTLLNLLHMKEMSQPYKAIDITECGENILLDVFAKAVEMEIPVILQHAQLPVFDNFSVLVDEDKIVTNDMELSEEILRRYDDDGENNR